MIRFISEFKMIAMHTIFSSWNLKYIFYGWAVQINKALQKKYSVYNVLKMNFSVLAPEKLLQMKRF